MIDRAKPLVSAIQAYESEVGRPPSSLELLVPKYLPAVPSTGLAAFPEYQYVADPEPSVRWRLNVRVQRLGFKHMRFDLTRQYEVPVTELQDGWVMITP